MSLKDLHTRKQKIQGLFDIANDHSLLGHDSHQYLCRYICIRTLSYLDRAIADILSEYCSVRGATPQINKIVDSFITRNAKNLHCGKISEILKSIDSEWSQKFEDELTEENSKFRDSKIPSQIDALKAKRDSLAHNDDTSIQLATLMGYYDSVNRTVETVKKIVLAP